MEWIKCSDRMPEEKERVLCYMEEEHFFFVGFFIKSQLPNDTEVTEHWEMDTEYLNCDTWRDDVFCDVTHWMPLPEIPIQTLKG